MARIVQALIDLLRRLFGRQEALPEPPSVPASAVIDPDVEVTDSSNPIEDDETPATVVPIEGNGEDTSMTRPTLSRGTSDKDTARELQALLNKNGEKLGVDGEFGPGTERAIKGFQQSYGLPVTGQADEATWRLLDTQPYNADIAYGGVPLPPEATVGGSSGVSKAWNAYGNLLTMLSSDLGIAPSVACAVLAVESAGQGFWDDRMVIRFENHIFHKYWGKANAKVFGDHFQMDSSKRWLSHKWRNAPNTPWRDLHTKTAGQGEEWAVLGFARQFDDTAALNSISMGAPQIMGFNAGKVGFDTVQEMFQAFSTDERAHVLGLFDFVRSDHLMVRSLRTGDWKGFAYIYNGSGQADYYGGKISENVAAAKKLGIA